ncbi:hypothetical protein [Furfurilactobacillus entadae]|uniref:hypothetical protein n=1 Tax=Furfurilactobacillus entadae TaxID=2922307 RepID=UPI0035EE1444
MNYDLPISVNAVMLLKSIDVFTDDNLFENQQVPQSFLSAPTFPFITVESLPTTDSENASNRRHSEYQQFQLDMYHTTNKELVAYKRRIEDLFSSHDFGCFFYESGHDLSMNAKRATWRFSKLINYEVK